MHGQLSTGMVTDSKGEADINFYTGDYATNYFITITGLTATGDLIYKRIAISNKERK